ncbi:MAG TPA: sulfite exporter TauE/SafE family protein [Chloroflexota bacterium]|nr:sulfite exporter TauE/SafE family protein [Chloroflexota bacterium]
MWRYTVAGLIGGFLSGFAGIGGGVVLIPLMVGLLGVSQHQAHGTSLAIIIPTAIVAVIPYFVSPAEGQQPPLLDLALAYTVTAVIGAPIGARLITYVNPKNLRQLFGLLLLSLSIGSLTRRTDLEGLGNLALVVGLFVLVVGTFVIAARQRRADSRAREAGVAR